MDGESVAEILAWFLFALLIVQNVICVWLAAQWRKTWCELEELRAALRTAATHDLVDRARHLELQGAEVELKRMARLFHAAPEMEKKWIDLCEWERAIKHQQEREELRRMTERNLGDGIAEK